MDSLNVNNWEIKLLYGLIIIITNLCQSLWRLEGKMHVQLHVLVYNVVPNASLRIINRMYMYLYLIFLWTTCHCPSINHVVLCYAHQVWKRCYVSVNSVRIVFIRKTLYTRSCFSFSYTPLAFSLLLKVKKH